MRHSPLTFATHTGKLEERLRTPMTHLWGKAIAAAAVVAGAGLGLTGTATAALPSVHLEICNSTSADATFTVSGRDQHNVQVRSTIRLKKKECGAVSRWRTGQAVTITKNTNSNATSIYLGSDLRDGSTQRFFIAR